jgi:hypothetical protein
MGHEMYYGFQNSPFLDLILSQKYSMPTLKALSLKPYKVSDFLVRCGMSTGKQHTS